MGPLTRSIFEYVNRPHIATEYDRYFADNALLRYDTEVLDKWFVEPGRLLDLGCGTGRHLLHFAQRGFEVFGIDLSPYMLREAHGKLRRAGLEARLVRGTITELPFLHSAGFQYGICMFSTIGMIRGHRHRTEFVRAVCRTLAPGGLFVCHVHNLLYSALGFDGLFWLAGAWVESVRGHYELGDKWIEGYRGIRHMYLHVFRFGEIRRLLQQGGLRVEQIVCLAPSRDRALKGRLFRGRRANGFIAIARKPYTAGNER